MNSGDSPKITHLPERNAEFESGSLPRLLNAIKIIRGEDASESRTSSSGYLLPMMTSLWRFNLPREPLTQ